MRFIVLSVVLLACLNATKTKKNTEEKISAFISTISSPRSSKNYENTQQKELNVSLPKPIKMLSRKRKLQENNNLPIDINLIPKKRTKNHTSSSTSFSELSTRRRSRWRTLKSRSKSKSASGNIRNRSKGIFESYYKRVKYYLGFGRKRSSRRKSSRKSQGKHTKSGKHSKSSTKSRKFKKKIFRRRVVTLLVIILILVVLKLIVDKIRNALERRNNPYYISSNPDKWCRMIHTYEGEPCQYGHKHNNAPNAHTHGPGAI